MCNPYSFYTAEERGSRGGMPGGWLDRGRAGLAPPALLLAADGADAGAGEERAFSHPSGLLHRVSCGWLKLYPLGSEELRRTAAAPTGLEPSGTAGGLSFLVPNRAVLSEPGRLCNCCT